VQKGIYHTIRKLFHGKVGRENQFMIRIGTETAGAIFSIFLFLNFHIYFHGAPHERSL
jgi:hypothetical protein